MQYKPYTYHKVSRFYPVYYVHFEETQLMELSGCTEGYVKRYVAQLNGAWLCGYGSGVASATVQEEYKYILATRERLEADCIKLRKILKILEKANEK